VLSAVAVTMAVSIQTEARVGGASFEAIQAEQLARSGQEFASFLERRGLSKDPDFMAGLPGFEAPIPGFHYRVRTATGTIDIYFEADNGRINPRTAPPELLNSFFAVWTGDVARAQIITDSVTDWSDPDDDVRPNGAEAAFYANLRLVPRNAPLGIADLPLIRGITAADFQARPNHTERETSIRPSLASYLTDASASTTINLNFAPELVLEGIPGLSRALVATVIQQRRNRPFEDMNAVRARTGLGPDSPAWRYLTVARNSPTVFTVARLKGTGLTRTERRVTYAVSGLSLVSGAIESKNVFGRIEKNVFPDYL
jgi:hypothetical protein